MTVLGCFIGSCVAPLMIGGPAPLAPNDGQPLAGAGVTLNGQVVGVYVDNEVPAECQAVADDRARGWQGLVLAARFAGGSFNGESQAQPCPDAVGAAEWYPQLAAWEHWWNVPCGWPAYIVERRFEHPTFRQRRALRRRILACQPRPRYLIGY